VFPVYDLRALLSLSSSGVGEYEFSGVESEGGERAGTPEGEEIEE